MLETIQMILESVPKFGILVVALFAGTWIFKKSTSGNFDNELTENDNPAFGVQFAGYLVGLGIALCGVLYGTGVDLLADLPSVIVGIISSILLMRASVGVCEAFILYKFSTSKEILRDRNTGTGFVVAGSCIASGLMINGVLTGESESLMASIVDIGVYWIVGQVILVIGGFVIQLLTSYDVHAQIENDYHVDINEKIIPEQDVDELVADGRARRVGGNMAAGISFGAFLVALGIITNAALAGATSNYAEEIVTTVLIVAFGILLLASGRVIADRVMLPKSPLSKEVAVDKNSAAAVVAAAVFICIALMFSKAITSQVAAGSASVSPRSKGIVAGPIHWRTLAQEGQKPDANATESKVVDLSAEVK